MKKRFSIVFYIIIIGAAILLAASFFIHPNRVEIPYSQVRQLFLEEQVVRFVEDDGTLCLELREPVGGSREVYHELAHMDTFREDLLEEINRQKDEGLLEEYNYIPHRPTPWYIAMLPYLLMGLLLIYILYVLLNRNNSAGNPAQRFSRANARVGSGSRQVTFRDVAGAEEEKQELQELVDFLRNPEKYRNLGARIPKGVLLVGPPGTGKTLLARAVAGEAGVHFLTISGSDFVELYVGVGASRVRDLFDQAKKTAPAIIFIDEIDAVGRRRGAGMGGGHDEREQTLNQLLVEMDGFEHNEGVIVMAATNRQDILDPALLRPGRFDRQISVNPPDVRGREDILKVHARNKRMGEDVDLATIARATPGFTGADLENLLNEAALGSARNDQNVITMENIESAILKVMAGPEKPNLARNPRDRKITAYHEAGHAVSMYYLPTQDPVHRITIVPRGNALGLTMSLPEAETVHMTRNEMLETIVGLLGGRVAEELIFDDVTTGAVNDLQRASHLAHDMVARFGMSRRLGAVSYDEGDEIFVGRDYGRTRSYSARTAGEIDEEVKLVVDDSYARCTQILRDHEDQLRRVAEFLLEHETMTRRQFEACMEGREIPQEAEGYFAEVENPENPEEIS